MKCAVGVGIHIDMTASCVSIVLTHVPVVGDHGAAACVLAACCWLRRG